LTLRRILGCTATTLRAQSVLAQQLKPVQATQILGHLRLVATRVNLTVSIDLTIKFSKSYLCRWLCKRTAA